MSESGATSDFDFSGASFDFAIDAPATTLAEAPPPSKKTHFDDAKAALEAIVGPPPANPFEIDMSPTKSDSAAGAAAAAAPKPQPKRKATEAADSSSTAAAAVTFQFSNDADWAGAVNTIPKPSGPVTRRDVALELQFLFQRGVLPVKELLLSIATYAVHEPVFVDTLVGFGDESGDVTAARIATIDDPFDLNRSPIKHATQCVLYSSNENENSGVDVVFVDSGSHRLKKFDIAKQRLSTFAGSIGGFANGPALSAKFHYPYAIAVNWVDHSLLVSDGHAGICIRRIGSDGVVSLLAGAFDQPGSVDGTGTHARFDGIHSLLVGGMQAQAAVRAGRADAATVPVPVYVCEERGSRLRRVMLPKADVMTVVDAGPDSAATAAASGTESSGAAGAAGAGATAAERQFPNRNGRTPLRQPRMRGRAGEQLADANQDGLALFGSGTIAHPIGMTWDHSDRTPEELKADSGGDIMYIATRMPPPRMNESHLSAEMSRTFTLRRYNTATGELSTLPLLGYPAQPLCVHWFAQHTLLIGSRTAIFSVSTRTGETKRLAGNYNSTGSEDGEPIATAHFNTVTSLASHRDPETGTQTIIVVDSLNDSVRVIQGSIAASAGCRPDDVVVADGAGNPVAEYRKGELRYGERAKVWLTDVLESTPAEVVEETWKDTNLTFNF